MFHNISEMLALFALEETRYSILPGPNIFGLPGPGRRREGGGGGGECPRPITLKLFMVLK